MAVEFYTDGSSKGNPGPGGWGIVAVENNEIIDTLGGKEEMTTNNRMELTAILSVMFNYGQKAPLPPPNVYSDSAYAINTLTNWMFNWEKNNWLKSDNKPPENLDLIKSYYTFYQMGYRINLIKVKGHAGNKFNELADKIAKGEEHYYHANKRINVYR